MSNRKDEKKDIKSLAKDEKRNNKLLKQEEKKRTKEEKRRSKEELKMKKKEEKELRKKNKNGGSTDEEIMNEVQLQKTKSEPHRVPFKFTKSRFVMPRAQKGYVFPVTPGPARYPITNINYPIMKARRQVELTKRMLHGPRPPAYTMGIKHTELREFYNKIQ